MRRTVSLAAILAGLMTPAHLLAQTVVGHIADLTDAPIVSATVELLDSYSNIRQRAFTDSAGRFVIEPGSPCNYHLRVHSIGYKSNTTPSFGVEFDDALRVRVVAVPAAVLLAPLEIHDRSRPLLRNMTMQGFEERRALGLGVAITRDRIEQRPGASVTDLLRLVPSLRVTRAGNATDLIIPGASRSMFGGPVPRHDLPGRTEVRVRRFHARPPVRMGSRGEIEVFRNLAELPAEMADPEARCGVIAVWTRRR